MRLALLFLSLLCVGCADARPEAARRYSVDLTIKNYIPGLRGHQLYRYANPAYRVGEMIEESSQFGRLEFHIVPLAGTTEEIFWRFTPHRTVSADAHALYERRMSTSAGSIIDVETGRVKALIRPIR